MILSWAETYEWFTLTLYSYFLLVPLHMLLYLLVQLVFLFFTFFMNSS